MATIDAQAILGLAVGIAGTVSAFGAKYAFDFRLARRRLELDERAAIATTVGGRPGQLRRSSIRMKDRVDGFFRDDTDMKSWLDPASSPGQDGYFLRSSVQRVFLFLSWAALMQQALDSLPAETLRARRDLQHQYALLDLSVDVLTNISMFPALPNYPVDRAEYHLFTGTVDELTDLGVAAHNRNSQVIPASEFVSAYEKREPALMQLREWISCMGTDDRRSAVIRARFACLGAVLPEIHEPGPMRQSFSQNPVLAARLRSLTPTAHGYPLASTLPPWMDAELAGALAQWRRA
jgi:hypothetical protein